MGPMMLAVAYTLEKGGGQVAGDAAGEGLKIWEEARSLQRSITLEGLLEERERVQMDDEDGEIPPAVAALRLVEERTEAVQRVQQALEQLGFGPPAAQPAKAQAKPKSADPDPSIQQQSLSAEPVQTASGAALDKGGNKGGGKKDRSKGSGGKDGNKGGSKGDGSKGADSKGGSNKDRSKGGGNKEGSRGDAGKGGNRGNDSKGGKGNGGQRRGFNDGQHNLSGNDGRQVAQPNWTDGLSSDGRNWRDGRNMHDPIHGQVNDVGGSFLQQNGQGCFFQRGMPAQQDAALFRQMPPHQYHHQQHSQYSQHQQQQAQLQHMYWSQQTSSESPYARGSNHYQY